MWPWTSHLTWSAIGSFIKLKGIPCHFLLGPFPWWKDMSHCWSFGRTHANTLIWSSEKNLSLLWKNYKIQRRRELGYKPTHTLPFPKRNLKEPVFWDIKQTGTKELSGAARKRVLIFSWGFFLKCAMQVLGVQLCLLPSPPLPKEKNIMKYYPIQCLSMWFFFFGKKNVSLLKYLR